MEQVDIIIDTDYNRMIKGEPIDIIIDIDFIKQITIELLFSLMILLFNNILSFNLNKLSFSY